MYIKRDMSGDRYFLCESYWEEDCWKSRVLVDLGHDPERYVEYPGGNSFYFKEELEDTLHHMGVKYSIQELERLFLPFMDPEIRRIYEMFDRGQRPSKWKGLSKEELFRRQKGLHSFDKRRLHYLRCGRVNIGNLEARAWGFLNVLLDKSRDEIETLIQEMEMELPPHEILPYIYTSLNMQRHFLHLLTRFHPWAMDQEKLDHFFLEDLCRLNQDPLFFRGVDSHDPDVLHPYLRRYAELYFAGVVFEPPLGHNMGDDFIGTFRFYRRTPPRKGLTLDQKEACKKLGISWEEFPKMTRQELARAFRVKAKEVHPDAGGRKEEFVEIKEAYEVLIGTKQ